MPWQFRLMKIALTILLIPLVIVGLVLSLFGRRSTGRPMTKLYKATPDGMAYWETWGTGKDTAVIHWGRLGERGDHRDATPDEAAAELEIRRGEGFAEIAEDDHVSIEVIYEIDGFGNGEALAKRHRLEDHLNELMGWTGLGHLDGGSIGSCEMEACVRVVDPGIARQVIAESLAGTEFADYAGIEVLEPLREALPA